MDSSTDTPRTLFRKDICKKRLSFYDSNNHVGSNSEKKGSETYRMESSVEPSKSLVKNSYCGSYVSGGHEREGKQTSASSSSSRLANAGSGGGVPPRTIQSTIGMNPDDSRSDIPACDPSLEVLYTVQANQLYQQAIRSPRVNIDEQRQDAVRSYHLNYVENADGSEFRPATSIDSLCKNDVVECNDQYRLNKSNGRREMNNKANGRHEMNNKANGRHEMNNKANSRHEMNNKEMYRDEMKRYEMNLDKMNRNEMKHNEMNHNEMDRERNGEPDVDYRDAPANRVDCSTRQGFNRGYTLPSDFQYHSGDLEESHGNSHCLHSSGHHENANLRHYTPQFYDRLSYAQGLTASQPNTAEDDRLCNVDSLTTRLQRQGIDYNYMKTRAKQQLCGAAQDPRGKAEKIIDHRKSRKTRDVEDFWKTPGILTKKMITCRCCGNLNDSEQNWCLKCRSVINRSTYGINKWNVDDYNDSESCEDEPLKDLVDERLSDGDDDNDFGSNQDSRPSWKLLDPNDEQTFNHLSPEHAKRSMALIRDVDDFLNSSNTNETSNVDNVDDNKVQANNGEEIHEEIVEDDVCVDPSQSSDYIKWKKDYCKPETEIPAVRKVSDEPVKGGGQHFAKFYDNGKNSPRIAGKRRLSKHQRSEDARLQSTSSLRGEIEDDDNGDAKYVGGYQSTAKPCSSSTSFSQSNCTKLNARDGFYQHENKKPKMKISSPVKSKCVPQNSNFKDNNYLRKSRAGKDKKLLSMSSATFQPELDHKSSNIETLAVQDRPKSASRREDQPPQVILKHNKRRQFYAIPEHRPNYLIQKSFMSKSIPMSLACNPVLSSGRGSDHANSSQPMLSVQPAPRSISAQFSQSVERNNNRNDEKEISSKSNWECLPEEILLKAFSFLPKDQLVKSCLVCKSWFRVAKDNSLWKSVNLKKCEHLINDDFLMKIAGHRPECLLFDSFSDRCEVTIQGLFNFFSEISKTLKEISFYACTGQVFNGAYICSLIEEFHVKINKLDSSHSRTSVKDLIKVILCSNDMKILKMNGCKDVVNSSIQTIAEKLGKSIEHLELRLCPKLNDASMIHIGLNCSNIKVLLIGQCPKISDVAIFESISKLSQLERFDCSGCKQITDRSTHILFTSCSKLSHISMCNLPKITNNTLGMMSLYGSNLKTVEVSGCEGITDIGIKSLVMCCRLLKSLDISSTRVTQRSLEVITNQGCANNCRNGQCLRQLKLNHIANLGEHAIIKMICRCKGLRHLSLYGVSGLPNISKLYSYNNKLHVEY